MKTLVFIILLFAQIALAQVVSSTKNVTTAGTAVALATSRTTASSVLIQAKPSNTGYIFVGDSTNNSAVGVRMTAGEKMSIATDHKDMLGKLLDLSTIYIDSTVNGEGVLLLYLPTR